MELNYRPDRRARQINWTSPDGAVHSSEDYMHTRVDRRRYAFHPPTSRRNQALVNITRVRVTDDGNYPSFFCPDDLENRVSTRESVHHGYG